MNAPTTVKVHFYTCSCDIRSKYCDEYHQAIAKVPVEVLAHYALAGDES